MDYFKGTRHWDFRRRVFASANTSFSRLRRPGAIIEAWRLDYNTTRPHGSLGNQKPQEFVSGGY